MLKNSWTVVSMKWPLLGNWIPTGYLMLLRHFNSCDSRHILIQHLDNFALTQHIDNFALTQHLDNFALSNVHVQVVGEAQLYILQGEMSYQNKFLQACHTNCICTYIHTLWQWNETQCSNVTVLFRKPEFKQKMTKILHLSNIFEK